MTNENTLPNNNASELVGPYPVIPLRDMVVGPHAMTTIFMSRQISVKAAEASLQSFGGRIILVTQRDKSVDAPTPDDFWEVGVVGEIDQLLRLPDGEGPYARHGSLPRPVV